MQSRAVLASCKCKMELGGADEARAARPWRGSGEFWALMYDV